MENSAAPFFELDAAKCVRCNKCARDCAFGALKKAADPADPPVMVKPRNCMRCQHCLAICPVGAIRIDGKKPEDSTPLDGAELPTAAATENWLRLRRSVRRFADADPDPALLDRLLRILGNTPTGCNARSLTFTCFPNRASMDRLRREAVQAIADMRGHLPPRWLAVMAIKLRKGQADLFFRGAPGLLVVSSDVGNPAVTTPREDVTLAVGNFELLANAHGLSTCWCGFLSMAAKAVPGFAERVLGVPANHPFAAMMFGPGRVHYRRGVQRDDSAAIVYRQ